MSFLAVGAAGGAQQYVPPPPPLTVDPCLARPNPLAGAATAKPVNCPPPNPSKPAAAAPTGTKGGSAAEAFPFPGEPSAAPAAKTAEPFPFPGDPAPIATPKVPAPAANGVAGQFPYPGETPASPGVLPDAAAGDTGSSSSSSSSSSSADPQAAQGQDAPPVDEPAAPKGGRRKLPKVSAKSLDERVSEDLEVAKFYLDHGNYLAAYMRSKDATKLMPEDAEGHFALGQASLRLGKKDEAAAEYASYLKLDPAGEKRRAAEQALTSLK